jgi:hypothetical protein
VRTRIFEATNGERNWGKFLVGEFDSEWEYVSLVANYKLLVNRGWRAQTHKLVLDLQTGEGAVFAFHGGNADLDKHKIWVCPLFEPFLVWLYAQPDVWTAPQLVDLPDAPFSFAGYRRPGPQPEEVAADKASHE